MIKKFARLGAPRPEVEALFFATTSWPEWMPGVRSLKILEQRQGFLRASCVQHFAGKDRPAELAIDFFPHRMHQQLRRSWIRRWDTSWRFLVPPDGRGTTVAMETIVDLGLLSPLMPSTFVEKAVDHFFDGILSGAKGRLGTSSADQAYPATAPSAEVLFQLFRTSSGLEVQVAGGRRFRL